MPPPPLAFRIALPGRFLDEASARLWELDTLGAAEEAETDREAVLVAYFAERAGVEDALRAALAAIPGCRVDRAVVAEVDWVARFRDSFRPFRAGRFLIAPAWDAPTPDLGATLLLVDPGSAFGTGTHETTRLCLDGIERLASASALGRVADVGAGSGILSVAACLAGAASAVAIDFDPEAARSARRHAALNRVPVSVVLGDGARPLRPGAFDTVLANLTAPLLLERHEELGALLRPGGRLVVSGFLVQDLPSVRSAFAARELARLEQADWTALLLEA